MSEKNHALELVGAIRVNAERIAKMHDGHMTCEDLRSSKRILELIPDLQEAINLLQYGGSLQSTVAAITSLPNETVYAMTASEIADVVKRADSNLKQTGHVIEVQGKDEYL